MRYYSSPDDEGMCYDFLHFAVLAKDEYKEPIIVELMKREVGGERWCKYHSDFVETRDCCGYNNCRQYSPCNHKNGKCRQLVNGFIGTGIKYRITEGGGIRKTSA